MFPALSSAFMRIMYSPSLTSLNVYAAMSPSFMFPVPFAICVFKLTVPSAFFLIPVTVYSLRLSSSMVPFSVTFKPSLSIYAFISAAITGGCVSSSFMIFFSAS